MEITRDIRNSDWKNPFNAQHLLNKTKGDKVIWALVVLLALVSLLAVYSATGSLAYKNYRGNTEIYLFKQIAFILVGIAVIYFAHLVNYTFYSRIATWVRTSLRPLRISSLSCAGLPSGLSGTQQKIGSSRSRTAPRVSQSPSRRSTSSR